MPSKKRPLPVSLPQARGMAYVETRKEARALWRVLFARVVHEFFHDSRQTTTCRKQMLWQLGAGWRGALLGGFVKCAGAARQGEE